MLMHNKNIKNFIDISYHKELEVKRLRCNTLHLSPMWDNDRIMSLSVRDKENMVVQLEIWDQRKEIKKNNEEVSGIETRIRPK